MRIINYTTRDLELGAGQYSFDEPDGIVILKPNEGVKISLDFDCLTIREKKK